MRRPPHLGAGHGRVPGPLRRIPGLVPSPSDDEEHSAAAPRGGAPVERPPRRRRGGGRGGEEAAVPSRAGHDVGLEEVVRGLGRLRHLAESGEGVRALRPIGRRRHRHRPEEAERLRHRLGRQETLGGLAQGVGEHVGEPEGARRRQGQGDQAHRRRRGQAHDRTGQRGERHVESGAGQSHDAPRVARGGHGRRLAVGTVRQAVLEPRRGRERDSREGQRVEVDG
mmetsp:Transcript_19099/g.43747  ORF Transcript_19099/g.43747 Transcript_19099/m.43747 type:complete len:225 (+) Transcript_19099:79-753(+)